MGRWEALGNKRRIWFGRDRLWGGALVDCFGIEKWNGNGWARDITSHHIAARFLLLRSAGIIASSRRLLSIQPYSVTDVVKNATSSSRTHPIPQCPTSGVASGTTPHLLCEFPSSGKATTPEPEEDAGNSG